MSACPCQSQRAFEECCSPFIEGTRAPARAEELMRARYSAYATGAIDFILATHDPETREGTDREALEEWSRESEWLGLEVLHTEQGEAEQKTGLVEFKAHFTQAGQKHTHHERASFKKRDGHWFFHDGKVLIEPTKRAAEKVGRNDPCPCGSGKKYKKCCLS